MKSPFFVLLIVAISVFIGESLVMLLLHYLPPRPFWEEGLLDATLLVILIAPMLYFFLFRPMAVHIRERLRIEETLLKNEEEQFKVMIHASLDGFWMTNMRGQFVEVNEAHCQLLGYPRAEFLQMCIANVDAVETPELVERRLRRLQTTGNDRYETRQRCKDGRILDFEVSANYSPLHGGRIYSFLRDITQRKRAEAELKLSAQLLNATSDTVFLLDLQGNFVYTNEAGYTTRGYTREELISMNLRQLNDPSFNALLPARMKTLAETGYAFFESAHICKNGTVMPVEINARLTYSNGRELALSVIRDITERKRAEALLRENEARLKELFENLSSGVVVYCASNTTENFVITAFNRAAERIENRLRAEVLGKNVLDVFPNVQICGLLAVLQRVRTSGVAEHFSTTPSEAAVDWREYYVYKLPNAEVVTIYDDVTQEKQAEAQMYRLAHYDILTDLPNRTLFSDRLQRALISAKREQHHFALMFLDLDNFKPVNDQMGHAAGDLLLKEVAKRLQNCVRESDTVSRVGGDEFVVLLPNITQPSDALQVAEKIRDAISQAFNLLEQDIYISTSIGIALYPEHGETEKYLIKHADIAMYYAKGSGRNNVMLYQIGMAG